MSNIEQLKSIVFSGGYDQEDKQVVIALEERLQRTVLAENLIQNPVIAEYIEYLKRRVEQAETLLKRDRTLNDRERDALFERIDISNEFLRLFTGEEKSTVEDEITQLLINTKDT